MVHPIYRAKNYEGNSKDYEFSPSSMETHLRTGLPRHGSDATPS
jgi:NTE family protein